MSTTTTDTKPASPAAKRASRARTKAADTKAKAETAGQTERGRLIARAGELGISKPAGKTTADLRKLVDAAAGLATGFAEAKSGPNALPTKAAGAGKAVAAVPSPRPSAPKAEMRRTTRGPRGVEARKVAAKLGKRGPGKRISDEELVKYCAKVAKQHPDTNASDELEQAYWVEKLAVNRDRFYRAWAEATKAKAA